MFLLDSRSSKMCKAAVKSPPATYQQLAFYGADALPAAQSTVADTKGKHKWIVQMVFEVLLEKQKIRPDAFCYTVR